MKRVLFIPSSGPSGTGEYYRCLAIARAMRRRAPELGVDFVIHEGARVERDAGCTYHDLPDTPTRCSEDVRRTIDAVSPSLVVFDSAGRVNQLRHARAAGAAVVWISDRPGKRQRGFRWRMMRQLDLHLTAAPAVSSPRLHLHERLMRVLCPGTRVRFFSGIAPEPDAGDGEALLPLLGVRKGDYVVFVAGGGGYEHDRRPVPELLVEAAREVHGTTGLDCVVVMGPQYRGDVHSDDRVRVVPRLDTEALTALLAGAHTAVVGAGSMMTTQALALRVPVVLFAAGGHDQPSRVRRLAARGVVTQAETTPQSLAAATTALVKDVSRRGAQLAATTEAGLRNDVGGVAAELLALASATPDVAPAVTTSG